MAITSHPVPASHSAASLPFDNEGKLPPWHPTPAFWLRRLSIALALALLALIYLITPALMRDGPSAQVQGSATVFNGCGTNGSTATSSSVSYTTCTLIVRFLQSGAEHQAQLQQNTPFPFSSATGQASYDALVTYHQRTLLGFAALGHLVITHIAMLNGLTLLSPGEQLLADTWTQLPAGSSLAIALLVLLGALLTFFYPWPVWKVRVQAEVLSMRKIELRNRDGLPTRQHLATLLWQTNIAMQEEVRIRGRLSRRLRPGDGVLLTYEHLRSGAFKSLRVSLPRSRKGWLPPGIIQIGSLTPWRWRWLIIALLWLEIPLSLLLLATVS
jgi:hypothetical protein